MRHYIPWVREELPSFLMLHTQIKDDEALYEPTEKGILKTAASEVNMMQKSFNEALAWKQTDTVVYAFHDSKSCSFLKKESFYVWQMKAQQIKL